MLFLASADYARRTGGYVYNSRLLDELARQGARLDLLTLETGFPSVDARERQGLAQTLSGLPPDSLVLTDHIYLCDLIEVFSASRIRVASIFHHSLLEEHGETAAIPNVDMGRHALAAAERRAVSRSSGVLVSSQETGRLLRLRYGLDAARIRIAIPGNETVARVAAGTRPGRLSILSVGAVIPRKRYDYMLDVADRLRGLDWHWQVAGDPHRDPALFDALQKRVDEAGLKDRFTFLGDVADSELQALWQTTDLFVATSRYEGYGMAVAEALRHGVPVVTTASGAVLTWAAGSVLEAPAEDADGAAACIAALLSDRQRLQAQAAASWAFGQSLPSWEESFKGMRDWLDAVGSREAVGSRQ